MESGEVILGTNSFKYSEPDDLLISDIISGNTQKSYFVATLDKLIKTDYSFQKDTVLYQKKDKDLPIVLIPGAVDRLFFSSREELLYLNFSDYKIHTLLKLEEPIQAGLFLGDQIYLITQNTLFRYNSEGKLEELAKIEQAHSLLKVLDDQLLIGSNLGLFHFNLVSNTLSVVIKNVEFNRGALYIEFDPSQSIDKIHAGSLNGLYSFPLSNLPELIESNRSQINKEDINNKTNIFFLMASMILISILGFNIWSYKNKLKSANQVIEQLQNPTEAVTRQQVEDYILNNLPEVSIKTILDEFNLNAPQLYSILSPEKPGSIIQNFRMERVKLMRKEGKEANVIATATGFSLSYLKKLKT
jgi:hypothetical protein